jgi:hypothetical protein
VPDNRSPGRREVQGVQGTGNVLQAMFGDKNGYRPKAILSPSFRHLMPSVSITCRGPTPSLPGRGLPPGRRADPVPADTELHP